MEETKFKTGDIIVGKPGTGFTITNENCLMKVLNIHHDNLYAEVIQTIDPKLTQFSGRKYDYLKPEDFRLATEDDIQRITNCEREDLRYSIELTYEEAQYIYENLKDLKTSLEDVWNEDWVNKEERDEEFARILTIMKKLNSAKCTMEVKTCTTEKAEK